MGILSNLFRRPQSDTYSEKRLRPRFSCAITTDCSDSRGNTWNCKIMDMSESGFGITTVARLSMGTLVNIVRPEVATKVVWATENKAGLRILR